MIAAGYESLISARPYSQVVIASSRRVRRRNQRCAAYTTEESCSHVVETSWRRFAARDGVALEHDPKKPAPDLIRGGYRFSEKVMLQWFDWHCRCGRTGSWSRRGKS